MIYGLYATSMVTAAAYDGARLVAGADVGVAPTDRAAAEVQAEAHIRDLLGEYGRDRLRIRWEPDPRDVVLVVSADHPSFLPAAVRRPLRLSHVERTIRVRVEGQL